VTNGTVLSIDFGTSTTVGMLRYPDGRIRPLLFDGSPLQSSAVGIGADGGLLVGGDALHRGQSRPAAVEHHLKQRLVERAIRIGDRDVAIEVLAAALFARVGDEARRILGRPPDRVVLTYPAWWSAHNRGIVIAALRRVGFEAPLLVPEPVAVMTYFTIALGVRLPPGACLLVYDFGGGTFDASLVRQGVGGVDVFVSRSRADTGGLDIDAAIVDAVGTPLVATAEWRQLMAPQTGLDRRARWTFWEDVRAAKEMLARTGSAPLHVPLVERDIPLGRADLDLAATPVVERTLTTTVEVLGRAGLVPRQLAGLFMVGGSCRVPMVGAALQQVFGIVPRRTEQPEFVVAEGGVLAALAGTGWAGAALAR
jgi:molecular chaperone DnaK (HSP70)